MKCDKHKESRIAEENRDIYRGKEGRRGLI